MLTTEQHIQLLFANVTAKATESLSQLTERRLREQLNRQPLKYVTFSEHCNVTDWQGDCVNRRGLF